MTHLVVGLPQPAVEITPRFNGLAVMSPWMPQVTGVMLIQAKVLIFR